MLNAISDVVIERLLQGLVDTLTMVGLSAGLALLLGLPLAVFLVLSAPGALLASPRLNRVLGSLVNGFRATPFIILLVALIPFTRWVTGTTIGVWAAVVPLTISATPFFARIAEVGLNEVDKGLIEAAQAMGCGVGTSSGTCCCPRPCPASWPASPSPWYR